MVITKTERAQRDDRVEHGRENRRQTIRTLKTFQHPALSLAQGKLAEWSEAGPLDDLQKPIHPQEKISKCEPSRVARQPEVAFVIAFGGQRVETDPGWL